jgi:hypothetical protein
MCKRAHKFVYFEFRFLIEFHIHQKEKKKKKKVGIVESSRAFSNGAGYFFCFFFWGMNWLSAFRTFWNSHGSDGVVKGTGIHWHGTGNGFFFFFLEE